VRFSPLLLLAALAAALTASTAGAAPSPLSGTAWLLTSLGGKKPLAETDVTARFAGGRISGSTGCNSYDAGYASYARRLRLTSPIAATRMACADPVMKQESAYLAALASVRSHALDRNKGKLTLAGGNGKALLVYAAQSEALHGTAWTVTGYDNGKQAVVSVIVGTKLDAAFGKDGRVSGSGGCNRYDATFETGAGTIAIGPVASTRQYCGTLAGIMEQEQQYLKALATAATYRIDGKQLELRTKSGAVAVTLLRR